MNTITMEDIHALMELASHAPKSKAEQLWFTQFVARVNEQARVQAQETQQAVGQSEGH